MSDTSTCRICGGKRGIFDSATIMHKYQIDYFRCSNCGFINTEEPYWLEEAYSSAIADSDIGLLKRNNEICDKTCAIINLLFKDANSFLDYGGGFGIYTRLMRDNGFDFEWYDAYCENIFAKGHEKSKKEYDVITCFEMFEHVYEPEELVSKLISMGKNILFTTELNSFDNPRKTDEWWYFCTDHGQHVSIYTQESLKILAQKNGRFYANCGNIHIFSEDRMNSVLLKVCNKQRKLINKYVKRNSLLGADYKSLTGKELV